jgi:hypothetical protein
MARQVRDHPGRTPGGSPGSRELRAARLTHQNRTGNVEWTCLKKAISVMCETEFGQSSTEDEIIPNGHTAMPLGSADEVFDKCIRDFSFSLDTPC